MVAYWGGGGGGAVTVTLTGEGFSFSYSGGGGGGGGGSYDSGTNDVLTGGVNAGDGQVSIDLLPGVPEPNAWALMLVGFGLTGAALRRRARRVANA